MLLFEADRIDVDPYRDKHLPPPTRTRAQAAA